MTSWLWIQARSNMTAPLFGFRHSRPEGLPSSLSEPAGGDGVHCTRACHHSPAELSTTIGNGFSSPRPNASAGSGATCSGGFLRDHIQGKLSSLPVAQHEGPHHKCEMETQAGSQTTLTLPGSCPRRETFPAPLQTVPATHRGEAAFPD